MKEPAKPASAKPKSIWWQAGPFEQWVKEVLISVLVPEGSSVCELMCGSGKDLGKWQRAKLCQYVGVDPQEHAIAEATRRWVARKKPFPAKFTAADPYQRSLAEACGPGQSFDSVVCFGKLQACFIREATTRTVLKNAAARLKAGGYFFGFLPDSSHIWTKAQEQVLSTTGSGDQKSPPADSTDGAEAESATSAFELVRDLYSLSFRDDSFPIYGCSYELRLAGQPENAAAVRKDYLVHFPTLINVAREYGLEMVQISNFKEFFEEYRGLFGNILVKMQVLETEKDRSLDKQQRELIELYSVFVFRKAGEAAGGAPNTDGHAANAAAADDVGGRNKKRKRSSQEGRPPPHH